MQVQSQDVYIQVTFEGALAPQGTSDAASYIVTSPGGGVPIAVLGVEALERFELSVSMQGTSSLVATPAQLSAPPRRSALRHIVGAPTVVPTMDTVLAVRLRVTKPTSGAEYQLEVRGLRTFAGDPYRDVARFTALATPPVVQSVRRMEEGLVLVTYSAPMRVDAALSSPSEYSIVGPTRVLVKEVCTISDREVLLTTVGLGAGLYTLGVNASGTPHDLAGNPISAVANEATFESTPAIAARSIFTDKGPITKPALTLQSGARVVIDSPTQVTLTGGNIQPSHVGLYLALEGAGLNDGAYRITSRVNGTVVRLSASLRNPETFDGATWSLIDYRDGQIANDAADVVVRVNGEVVTPEAVIGLLGQVVLPVAPSPEDDVQIDYAWVSNPVVDLRRLNSKEFRLNNWHRDTNQSAESAGHKYLYSSTLIVPETFVALDMRAALDQPQQRDLKYRAYERAYSVALNDPELLLLNAPNHRIAYPPMSRPLTATFVNYEGAVLPETSSASWVRAGAGSASVSGNDLVVQDTSGTEPIFWTKTLDLTYDHVFALAWRVKIDSIQAYQGIFTGVVAAYSNGAEACVVGFLESGIGILRRGYGNDPSTYAAWAWAPLDWSTFRSYRVFRERNGAVKLYVDGSVVPLVSVSAGDLPSLRKLNAPFRELQGPFFGSLSREAESRASWSFVRYTAIPVNPLESAPSIFVSYEGLELPEVAAHPWTPVGFHGTETILDNTHLLLDSTSATDLPSSEAAGLISGDFKGYTRIEPLLKESFDTVLDVRLAIRTSTQGIAPNAVMAAIDDGDRLMQLSLFSDRAAPKLSYGGRSLPPDFSPYPWRFTGTQTETASLVGQYLKISDSSDTELVYWIDDDGPETVFGPGNDYILEFRVCVLSYEPDQGFCGVTASAYDGARVVGIQFTERTDAGQKRRYLELHSEGAPLPDDPRFAFEWADGQFHTIRVRKSTNGDQVSVFADAQFLGSYQYSAFLVSAAPSPAGKCFFGSATPSTIAARSEVLWAYANCWRVTLGRKFAGLWKGYDSNALTGYHLPISASGRAAAVHGNSLVDALASFVTQGVTAGELLVIDDGPNKGVYEIVTVSNTQLTFPAQFPSQPSQVAYRCVKEVDWSLEHHYRIAKSAGGVSVYLDGQADPLIYADYANVALPPSSAGIPRVMSAGLPSVTWGAFDPTNLSQTYWDFVRVGAIRSLSASGIAPHHQVLNQRNIIASFEHRRTNIPHSHTNFWSESEGIPPQAENDLLHDPNLVAFTLLNDRTPLVPSTQAYEVRSPALTVVPLTGDTPQDALGQRLEISIPDDILYNSLQVIERSTGEPDLLAPFAQLAQVNVATQAYDEYHIPQPTAAGRPFRTHPGAGPAASVTRLNSADVLWHAGIGVEARFAVALPLADALPAPVDGPVSLVIAEVWPPARVALLNNTSWKLFTPGAPASQNFRTADNLTAIPVQPGVSITL
jgi:hypothetical protein